MSYSDKVSRISVDTGIPEIEVHTWPTCRECGWPTHRDDMQDLRQAENQKPYLCCEGCADDMHGSDCLGPCFAYAGEPEESFEMENPADVWREDCY